MIYRPPPNTTLFHASNSSLSRVALRYSNSAGIKVVGDHNTLSELLILDTDWLGTLDYPPLEIGFGLDSDAAPGPDAPDEDGSVDSVGARRNATELAPQVGMAMFPRNTQGRNNTVTRVTVGRFGNAGIVTSQLSNEVSFAHVFHGGLVGKDDACIHADNSMTPCRNRQHRPWCQKHWHHNCTRPSARSPKIPTRQRHM